MLKSVREASSMFRIQTWNSESVVPAALNAALGVAWPQTVGADACGHAEVICVGPTDWLVIAADRDVAPWLERLNRALSGGDFRAINLSDALVRIELGGPRVRDLLAKGCSLDLCASRFAPGRSARTRFAGMAVIVRCTGDFTFECIVTQSHADYLLSWVNDAIVEFESAP